MRHALLLTAVATVTIPGLLAVMAVMSHEHIQTEEGVTAALSTVPLTGPFPIAAASARASVRNNVAAAQGASGAPATVLSRVTASQQAAGMRLLNQAADASLSTSYQGTELISQSDAGGSVKMISQVWHQGGGSTLVETSNGGTASAAAKTVTEPVASSDPEDGSPEGVFGVTKPLMALLGKHYVAVYRGAGTAVGRPATVVDLYSFGGYLAARYWLDKQTMVPLRRELFNLSDNVISEDSFVQVQFGALAMPQLAQAGASADGSAARPQSQAQSQSPSQLAWVTAPKPRGFLTSLNGQGWQVTGTLPGGLPLYAAASATTASGEIVDLEYSDGLYDVSLFVQRGSLAPDMTGWRQKSMDGRKAFVSGHSVTWSGSGFVYTMIADAPSQIVTQVVGALPDAGRPGLLDRLGRGFARLARVINPFG
ncbi:MAG TPA: sigma-E factor regulatory protein RseB domain-containing protein [Trebonia sp.]